MRFDPQAGMMSDSEPSGATMAGPSGTSRTAGQVAAGVIVLAGALMGYWIWRTQMAGPQQADAAGPVAKQQPTRQDAATDESTSPSATLDDAAAADEAAQRGRASDEALAAVDRALMTLADEQAADAVSAQHSDAALEQGKQHLAMGRTTRAIELLREAVRLNPASAEAHYNLGLAYVLLGRTEAARQERDALRELDSNLASLLGNLVR